MVSHEEILTRNKITGVLLRSARVRAGESIESCAEALSCEPEYITRVEEGEAGLTLPQLESLAHLLEVPLGYLLGREELPVDDVAPEPTPYDDIMTIRRKIIGVILRQARQEAGQTLDDVAPILGYAPEYLDRVELGEEKISLVELDILAQALGVPFGEFIADDLMPATPGERGNRDLQQLAHLPPQIREFVLQPINMPYLRWAVNISQLPSQTLRQIASGLLEITY